MSNFNGWNDWLRFRQRFRMAQKFIGIPIALISVPLNCAIMNSSWIDPVKPIVGLDPFAFIALSTVATGTVGYLIGSSLPMFYLKHFNHTLYSNYNTRLGIFYNKIVKHRANVPTDPSKLVQSTVDFYGEKITTLSDYRKWLRTHRQIALARKFTL